MEKQLEIKHFWPGSASGKVNWSVSLSRVTGGQLITFTRIPVYTRLLSSVNYMPNRIVWIRNRALPLVQTQTYRNTTRLLCERYLTSKMIIIIIIMDIKDSDTFCFYLFVFFLDGKLMRILKLSIYELISRENNIKC